LFVIPNEFKSKLLLLIGSLFVNHYFSSFMYESLTIDTEHPSIIEDDYYFSKNSIISSFFDINTAHRNTVDQRETAKLTK